MEYRRGFGVVALGTALVTALAACGSGKGDGKSGGGSAGTGAAAQAGPPPGGWPQPENGRLTAKMCGLLTDVDYRAYGHNRLPSVDLRLAGNGRNAIDCLYMTNDELTLDLQTTAQEAKIVYDRDLRDHKERLASERRQSVLAENVVPGVDASWFDYWTIGSADSKSTEYELRARRGSLTLGLVLSGIKGKNEKDPRTLLSGLASLVFQRIPDVGKKDTGTTHQVQYVVTGRGRARQINYGDPVTNKSFTLKNVKLPWHREFPVPAAGSAPAALTVSGTSASFTDAIGCAILVDSKPVKQQAPQLGLVFCTSMYGGS